MREGRRGEELGRRDAEAGSSEMAWPRGRLKVQAVRRASRARGDASSRALRCVSALDGPPWAGRGSGACSSALPWLKIEARRLLTARGGELL